MAIAETLTQFVTEELLADYDDLSLGESDDLLTTGLIDSLGVMRLVAFIEDSFQIKVPYEDITIENFCSVQTMTHYVQSQSL